MYQEYHRVWSQHREQYGPKIALLYQVGGFFEIYDTENLTTGQTQANIREIAELCQLSLSVKSAGTDAQTLFGGFPEHSLVKFERTLVQAGYTVVVVVQKKGKKGDVIDRVVDHISSPGCYVDTLSVKERRLVGCVVESISDGPAALRRVYWAAVAMDIATGRIWFVEGADRDRLHQFLCIHPPSELVLWSDGLPAANALTDSLKQVCDVVHLRCLPVASVALEEAALEKRWPNCRKRLDWMAMQPQARRSLSYLMTFAAEHVPSSLQNIHLPIPWIPDGEVRLGNAALEQLGLLSLKSGGGGGGGNCLLDMMDQCRSMAGKRLLRSRLMRPISNTQEIRRRLDAIDRAAGITDPTMAANTERGLRSLYDISRLFRRLELGTANLNDVACLLRSYEAVRTLRTTWGSMVPAFLDWIPIQWDVRALTELARDGANSVPVRFLPFVAGSLPPVEACFAKGMTIRKEAEQLCQSWSSLGKGEPLYLDDAEGGGFRITGTKRRIASVQASLKDKGVEATTYKTSAILTSVTLDAISTRHRAWFAEWTATWTDTWSAVCADLVERSRDITTEMEQWCADLDVTWTVAKLQQEWCWNRPEIVDAEESFLEVTKLRHPILERIQTQNPYVSHSVAFGVEGEVRQPDIVGTSRGLLLYGMNASGKSSLMKAIGLCVLLAQAGFPVPAATCRLSPFTAVFTRILGNDNLWAGLSSFAVEMTEFREILRFADHRSLVLGDELCSGTESLSATALVAAGVETLTQRGTKFVFATHLHELATLPDIVSLTGVKAVHLKVHYDAANDRLIYDRCLAPGSGSALYGLEVCRALDLPLGYLERATVLRQQLAGWQGPKLSSYSSAAVMEACAICKATGYAARLEMHHIRPQAEAVEARAEGFDIHAASNLVCLCAVCHDHHHAGILEIQGWQDTSAGRILRWSRKDEKETPTPTATVKAEVTEKAKEETQEASTEEIHAWVRDQHRQKIRIATIQRMAIQIFGVELSEKEIRAITLKRFQHSAP